MTQKRRSILEVVIFGAGSVGAHYARAWSKSGANVTVFDVDVGAVLRFSSSLWPQRYGQFPANVTCRLWEPNSVLVDKFDLAVIGTPPDTHADVLHKIAAANLKILQAISIQKPVSSANYDDLERITALSNQIEADGVKFYSGYNHRFSQSFMFLSTLLNNFKPIDEIEIHVDWRESWDGILQAHPWITGPEKTYLGFTHRGGGALFEHSHGLDLGLWIWRRLKLGAPVKISSALTLDETFSFDSRFEFTAETLEARQILTVYQDVKTKEVTKQIQITAGEKSLHLQFSTAQDTVIFEESGSGKRTSLIVKKTREEDFDAEVRYICSGIQEVMKLPPVDEYLDFSSALEVSRIASYCSGQNEMLRFNAYPKINYSGKGFISDDE